MDKKKVKEKLDKIQRTLESLRGYNDRINKLVLILDDCVESAQKELSKSDWVSVEDGLPPYEEVVDVRIDCGEGGDELNEHIITYGSTHRVKSKSNCSHLRFDKNDFIVDYNFMNITHWKPIEKLEE